MASARSRHARTWPGRVLVTMALVLAACDDVDDTSSSSPGADETPADALAQGVLRIGDFTDVTSFDPVLSQNTQAAYLLPVYDTLVRQDADHALVPHLATAWTEIDENTLRFSLRDDVVFHDGARFDASVVKANIDRARSTESNPNLQTFTAISDVVVVDTTTVDVRFTAPHPTFLLDMSLVQGMMVSPDAIAAGTDLTREPHGSGGWTWSRADSQDGARQVFVLNPDYWAPELQGVARFEISVVADNAARFNALQTGQLDLMYGATATQIGAALDAGLEVLSVDADMHFLLITDRGGRLAAPLADPRVRRAIGHAIDREGYVDAVLDGVGSSSGGLVSPSLSEWYDESLAAVPIFDPDLARELLAEAGYPDGFEITLPTLPLLQINNEAIAQMLGDVGISVELAQLQPGQLGPEMRKGSYGAAFTTAAQYHPHDLFATFVSGAGPFNPFGMDDTGGIDAALLSAARADPASARRLYADVQRQTIEAGILIPVAFGPLVLIASEPVENAFVPLGLRVPLPYGLRLADA